MYKAGFAKVEMTYFEPNIGMFGFGLYEHRAQGIETPLYARALIIEDEQKNKTAIVVCEIAAIPDSLKSTVLKKLKEKNIIDITPENLLLSANHTHSAAGGYFHYPFYNFSNGGFHPPVLEKYAESTANAIIEANNKLQEAELSVHKGSFDLNQKVCFNRSLPAYNANTDVEKVLKGQEHLATDREMVLLKVTDKNNRLLGCINWFGVHTTSCGNDHYKICSDNKGYAATFHEEKYKETNPGFISIFAQKPCGDITPLTQNLWISNRAKKLKEPDYVHAAENGKMQFEKADEILHCEPQVLLNGNIDSTLTHSDFSKIRDDEQKQITTNGALGLAFFRGAVDGRGISVFLKGFISCIVPIVAFCEKMKTLFTKNENEKQRIVLKYKLHTTKKILVETTDKRILGINSLRVIPAFADKLIEQLVKQDKAGGLDGYPLTPSILPLQIIRIGQLSLVALPAEITITAGKRMQKQILEILKSSGVEQLIVAPYSNEFSGYITTPEEHHAQSYEGGHTLFGEQTLTAYIQETSVLANEMLKQKNQRKIPTLKPPAFSSEILNKRRYASS